MADKISIFKSCTIYPDRSDECNQELEKWQKEEAPKKLKNFECSIFVTAGGSNAATYTANCKGEEKK